MVLNVGRGLEEAAPLFNFTPSTKGNPPNINDAYTNEQIASIAERSLPDRGIYCDDCDIYVPIFESVDDPFANRHTSETPKRGTMNRELLRD